MGEDEREKAKATGRAVRQKMERPTAEHVAMSRPDLAIVDKETWAAVRAKFAKRGNGLARRQPFAFPLAGLAFCSCGQAIIRSHVPKGVPYLACSGRRTKGATACENSINMKEQLIVDMVTEYVHDIVLSPMAIREDLEEISCRVALAKRAKKRPSEVKALKAEIKKLETEIKNIVDGIAAGKPAARLLEALAQRESALEAATKLLLDVTGEAQGFNDLPTLKEALEAGTRLRERLKAGGEEARDVLRKAIESIVVLPYGGEWSDGWTLEIKTRPSVGGRVCAISGSGGGI